MQFPPAAHIPVAFPFQGWRWPSSRQPATIPASRVGAFYLRGAMDYDVRARRRRLLTTVLGSGLTYAQYVQNTLAPVLWYRLRETSGTTAVNSGSAGSAANGTWTAGAGAVGQTGKLGANEAYDFDALASKIVIPNIADIQALETYTIIGLCKADGAGENNAGTVFHLGAGSNGGFRRSGTSNAWQMHFDTDGTDASSLTNTGFMPNDTWLAMFGTFDNAGDRTARIYKGVGGVVAEATYSTQTAATGTRVTPTGAVIGNFSDVRTWDGLIDEVIVCNRVLSSAEMLQYTQLAGV